jgi:hypothetical protein
MSRRRKPVQLELRERTWGGKREGAGRPKTEKKYVPHRARPEHKRAHPVHVTLRARVSALRDFPVFEAVATALAKGSKAFFRVCEYSVQRNHIHLIIEADGVDGCSSGKWFDGWEDSGPAADRPLPRPTQWLLRTGWRRQGLIHTRETPRTQFLFD